jgi:hypothetical protein
MTARRWTAFVAGIGSLVLLCALAYGGSEYFVEISDPQRAYGGNTLLADNSNPDVSEIVEINMAGQPVWRYSIPGELAERRRNRDQIVMQAQALPNSNILFNIQHVGLFEIDRKGTILWQYRDSGASHDVRRLPNGNTLYCRGWVSKGKPQVVEVDSAGKVVWTWDGLKHFDRPPYGDISKEGWMHINGAVRLANGNTLISIRNFNCLVEVSPDDSLIWKLDFPLVDMPIEKKLTIPAHPHSPVVLPGGNVLVSLTGINLIVEVDRKTGVPVWKWEYPQKGKRPVHIRDASRLPNGNTLFVESNAITELTPEGTPVWKMVVRSINPGGPRFTYLFKAQRIIPPTQSK